MSTRGQLVSVFSPADNIDTQRMFITDTAQAINNVLRGRRFLLVNNLSSEDIYLGGSSVSSGDGWPIFAQTWQSFELHSDITPYLVNSSGASGDVRIMEVA